MVHKAFLYQVLIIYSSKGHIPTSMVIPAANVSKILVKVGKLALKEIIDNPMANYSS